MDIQELALLQSLLLQFEQMTGNNNSTEIWAVCKMVHTEMAKLPQGIDDHVSL